jgi:tetratricopeptide (TPR) repeat protein
MGALLVRLANALHIEGETSESAVMMDDGLRLLEGQPSGRLLAEAYVFAAGHSLLAGQSERTQELSERAISFGETLDLDSMLSRALGLRGAARCNLGDPGGIEDLRRSLDLSLKRGDSDATGAAFINLGDVVWTNEGPEAGLKVHRDCIEYCARRGVIGSAMWATAETTWMLYDNGEWDAVLSAADEVTRWVERGGTGQTDALALPFMARVFLERGNVAAAQRVIHDLLPRARRIGDPQVLAPTLVTAASWELVAGNHARALELVKECVEIATEPVYICWMLTDMTRILVECGAVETADDLLASARPSLARELHAALTARAILAEARGKGEEALGLFLEAADRWASFPAQVEHGHALFGAGRCLIGLGRAAEGRERFEQARAIFGSLGALPLVAEVDAVAP